MNKPTPHRLLHDALEPEVYAKVMRNFDAYVFRASMILFMQASCASKALYLAFIWELTPQGYDYWDSIHKKLLQQEQLNEKGN